MRSITELGAELLVTLSQNQGISADSEKSVDEIPEFIKLHSLDLNLIKVIIII